MKQKCIDAVMAAAGRPLKQIEIQDIENRIRKNQRQLAQTDRENYLAMSPEQQLQAAAKLASEEFLMEAAKKYQRMQLTAQKHDVIDAYVKDQKMKYGHSGMESLQRILAVFDDGKSNIQSIESRAHAIAADHIRQLLDTFESTQPKIMGLFQNKEGIEALICSLFGEDITGKFPPEVVKNAKAAAEAWSKVTETARQQFNNTGGQIGRLEDWHMPQSHSQQRVATAGQEQWIKDTFDKLDRQHYTKEDGSLMNGQELTDFLKEAWTTIATGGANKIEPGKVVGRGMLANAHAEERALHFKTADGYMDYQNKYGGYDAYTVMMKHIQKISHDIAITEKLGPNPDLQFKYWLDKSTKEDSIANPKNSGKINAKAISTQNLYDSIAGKTMPVANWKIAQGFDTLRNWLIATRLGSAFITSITDNATMHLTAAMNNMSSMQLLRNQFETLNMANKDELRMARRAGLSLNTLIGEMNRWGADALGPTFSAKASNLTMRASLLNAATEARRRAFGVTMYGSIGHVVKEGKTLRGLEDSDRKLLEAKGVTNTDFSVWKEAQQENWGNGNDTMLTPEAIYRIPDEKLAKYGDPATLRREAALKLLGMVNEEVNMAVIEPGARERAMIKMGTQRGTWKGELVRSFFLFKSFPIAMITKHWARALGQEGTAAKAKYLGAFLAGTTVLGAAAQQISNLIAGRDPQDMTSGRFWTSAALKGGSLGIYGDFLFSTNTSYGNTPGAVLAGPVASYMEDMIGLTQGSLVKAAQGQRTDAGANAVKVLKSNIPLQNLWYTKAITDRLLFNQLQEMVSPGYMARIEQRARKEFHQSYYWRPGEVAPHRAPDLTKAAGQ